MNRRTQVLIAIAFLLGLIIIALSLALIYKDNTVILSISTGVLGSILAGLVYTIFSNVLFGSSLGIEDVRQCNLKLSSRLENLDRIGAEHLADRRFFDDKFWEEAIKEVAKSPKSTSELILLGRTLDNWLKSNFKEIFSDAIIKVVQNGGRVEIVSLKPNSSAAASLTRATGVDMTRLSCNFDNFIEKSILSKLNAKERLRVNCRHINELQPTFTLFRSDNLLWISPYLSTRDTGSNIALTIRKNSTLAARIMDDYQEIRENHTVGAQLPIANGELHSGHITLGDV